MADDEPTLRIPPTDVLLAEDDDALRELLDRVLRELGLVVRTAHDGLELARELDAARWLNRPPRVVLTDLAMPGRSGIDVLAALPEGPSRPAVLVMTAYPEDGVAELARSLGAVDVLAKPFDLERVVGRVVACLAATPARGRG